MEHTNETEKISMQEHSKLVYARLKADPERMRRYKQTQKQNCVLKYKADEEFRNKLKARSKAYYYAKKAEKAKLKEDFDKLQTAYLEKFGTG